MNIPIARMTWREFKQMMEDAGITDDDYIEEIVQEVDTDDTGCGEA